MAYTEEWVTARARDAYEHGRASFDVRPERTALAGHRHAGRIRPPRVESLLGARGHPDGSPGCGNWSRTAEPPRYGDLDHLDDTHLGLDRPHALPFLPHANTDCAARGPAEVWAPMGRRPDEAMIRKPSTARSTTPRLTRCCATSAATR
ncbi:hypothetical protein GCM10019016_062500 [Streptomyces prasinosporus]|uniref:Uncharacterized protein n=1 Tax=Streptomyces prasinosporus TaxID=68256 RepID=A0ABP6TUV3_9ACTN